MTTEPCTEGRTPPLRILVADDYPDIAASWGMLLRAAGHEVVTALDGAQALEVAKRHKPDVALLDLVMPVLDGYGVAARLRAADGEQPLLVAISACDDPEDQQRCHEVGFDLHVPKPADPLVILRLLNDFAASRSAAP